MGIHDIYWANNDNINLPILEHISMASQWLLLLHHSKKDLGSRPGLGLIISV